MFIYSKALFGAGTFQWCPICCWPILKRWLKVYWLWCESIIWVVEMVGWNIELWKMSKRLWSRDDIIRNVNLGHRLWPMNVFTKNHGVESVDRSTISIVPNVLWHFNKNWSTTGKRWVTELNVVPHDLVKLPMSKSSKSVTLSQTYWDKFK